MKSRAPAVSLLFAAAAVAGCQPSDEELAARYEGVVSTYCLECHDAAGREAGLSLEGVELDDVAAHAELFEEVTRKLRGRQMPPLGGPRPDAETYDGFVAYLERRLDESAAASPEPGKASIHRLNRTEYGNAVRDLLALEVDAAEFLPADDEGYGFDNIADVLRVSPSLLEQYLSASAKIAALAVGDPDAPAVTAVYRPAPDLAQGVHVEGLPLGTRGGFKIRHNFPLDAEYELDVFLVRNIVGYMTGLEWAHELEIAVDGERVFLAQVGGDADNALSDANMSAAANEIDARLRTRTFVTAGPHDVTVAFLERSAAETHEPLELHTRNLDLQDMNGLPIVDYVNLRGPFNPVGPGNTPSRERIFTCRPADDATARVCATEILSTLARRAYRRQPTEQDIATLLSFYDAGSARGGFDAGIESALRVILTSPKFLFRDEPDPAGAAPGSLYALDDSALASRLAFFLWSAPPDDELLDLATRKASSASERVFERAGRPHARRPALLGARRELRGPVAIPAQPAQRDARRRGVPELRRQPAASDAPRDRAACSRTCMREDRPVGELLTADYTFVNERLAQHYGIPSIYGSHFRKVPVADEARRGLLGHASILTVTSYPNRTSPVLRGKWVLENVIGAPPPPPLPDVPALEENEAGKAARTLRERLARASRESRVRDVSRRHGPDRARPRELRRHRQVAHARAGRRRSTPMASSWTARRSTASAQLREALTADPEQFARVFTEKLLTYALGRGLEAYDMPTVRRIVREAEGDDYRFSALVKGIVNSVPFRMRRAQSSDAPDPGTIARRP